MNCHCPHKYPNSPDTCCCGAHRKPTYIIHFLGGSLGGKEQAWHKHPPLVIRVPVMPRTDLFASASTEPQYPPPYETDLYEYVRRVGAQLGEIHYDYRWRRPDTRKLEKEVAEYRALKATLKKAIS